MRAQHYDVVFLGARTISLLGAAYMARNGLRVLVLGHGTHEPTYRVEGIDLPRTPTPALPLASPALRHVLEAIAVMPSLKRRTTRPAVALPIRIGSKSLDLDRSAALRRRAIEREFPSARRAMANFERRAELARQAFDAYVDRGGTFLRRGFKATRSLRRLESSPVFEGDVAGFSPFDELRAEPLLVEALELPLRFRSNAPRAPSGLPFALAYDRALDGPALFEGGESWLRRVVIERIESYGGDVRPRVAADRLLVSKKAVSGLRIRTSHEEVGASAVVAGVPASALVGLLPEGSVPPACLELLRSPEPALARYLLNVELATEGVPSGLDHELFTRPRGAPRAIEALHVERVRETDGGTWLSAEALVPLPLAEPASMRGRALDALREAIPFFDTHLLRVSSPHDDLGVEGPAAADGPRPDEGPVVHESVAPESLDALPRQEPFGLVGLPTNLPLDGLHIAGTQCMPELGVEGEVLALLDVARHLLEKSGSARFSRLAPFRSRRW